MGMTDLSTAVESEIGDEVQRLTESKEMSEAEVVRRLIRLGLEDIVQIGDDALQIVE